jgi:hypothetical protein
MTFEERLAEARTQVVEFLNDLRPPRGFSDDALAKIIEGVSDAFARRLPLSTKEDFSKAVAATFVTVADNHKGYTWPSQAAFVDAMPRLSASSTTAAAETYAPPDHLVAAAAKMQENQPIAEGYVWGRLANRLIGEGFLRSEVMDKYRIGSALHFRDAYGEEGEKMMVAKYGAQAAPYYRQSLAYPIERKRAGA